MTDKKRTPSRSQMAEPKARSSEKEQPTKGIKATAQEERTEQPVKSVKAVGRDERKEQPKKEVKRREAKGPSSLGLRFRNNRFGRFVLDAYYELRHKVTWPTFEEARNYTLAVILLSAVIGGILSLADFGLYQLFLLLGK